MQSGAALWRNWNLETVAFGAESMHWMIEEAGSQVDDILSLRGLRTWTSRVAQITYYLLVLFLFQFNELRNKTDTIKKIMFGCFCFGQCPVSMSAPLWPFAWGAIFAVLGAAAWAYRSVRRRHDNQPRKKLSIALRKSFLSEETPMGFATFSESKQSLFDILAHPFPGPHRTCCAWKVNRLEGEAMCSRSRRFAKLTMKMYIWESWHSAWTMKPTSKHS